MTEEFKKMQPHSVVKKVFRNYSYLERDYYILISQGLIKNQAGYYNCHSINDVLTKLGFIGKKTQKITKRGREYLFRYFYDSEICV